MLFFFFFVRFIKAVYKINEETFLQISMDTMTLFP